MIFILRKKKNVNPTGELGRVAHAPLHMFYLRCRACTWTAAATCERAFDHPQKQIIGRRAPGDDCAAGICRPHGHIIVERRTSVVVVTRVSEERSRSSV